jgi:hypothetical protein
MVMSVSFDPPTQFAEAAKFRVTGVPKYTALVSRVIGICDTVIGTRRSRDQLPSEYSCFFSVSQIYFPDTKYNVATV